MQNTLELNKIISESQKILDRLGIPYRKDFSVRISTRLRSKWGFVNIGKQEIVLNEVLIGRSNGNMMPAVSTLVHEYLHTAPGGNGHMGRWQEYAGMVNSLGVPGLDVRNGESWFDKFGDGAVKDLENMLDSKEYSEIKEKNPKGALGLILLKLFGNTVKLA